VGRNIYALVIAPSQKAIHENKYESFLGILEEDKRLQIIDKKYKDDLETSEKRNRS
jgi:hypothetical protein